MSSFRNTASFFAIAWMPSTAFAQTSTQSTPMAQTPAQRDTGASLSSAPPQAPAQSGEPSTVADIVVTAQKRSENLQKVPIAITAVAAAQLSAAHVTSTNDIQNVAPAVTFSKSNGFVEPRIRGIGNSSQGAGVENSVATYVDGVYISSAAGAVLDLSNVQQVEVLKGPQGTLFGRNATGGLIQIITNDPQQALQGRVGLDFDSYDKIYGTGYLTGPLTDTLSADIALVGSHQGIGYGHNLTTGQYTNRLDHDIGVRSKLLWRPSDRTKVRLSFDYSDSLGSDPTISLLSGTASAADRNANGTPIKLYHNPWDTDNSFNSRQSVKALGTSLNISQDLGFATLTDIAAYRRTRYNVLFDADFTPVRSVYEQFSQKDEQYSDELQLTSKRSGRLQWVVGGYFYRLNSGFLPLVLTFGQPVASTQTVRDHVANQSIAGYGQLTYELLPGTHLTGGFRYTNERRTIDGDVVVHTVATGATVTTPIVNPALRQNTPTWRLSLDHQFGPQILGYVSWNRGFKSGGFNASAPTTPSYRAEYIDACEVGAKTLLFDRHLRLNAAAFLYDYRNLQVNTLVGSIGVTYNGAKARIYGLDVDAELVATDHLSFTGGATLLHDRFTSFPSAIIPIPNGDGTERTVLGSAAGNRLPFAPDATLLGSINYKHDLAGGQAQLTVNNSFSTGYRLQADNQLRQKSYNMLGSTISWTDAPGTLTLRLFANNLLNKAVLSYGATSATTVVEYQPPRVIGGGVAYRF